MDDDEYMILDVIGSGSRGCVFKVYSVDDPSVHYALKVVRIELNTEEEPSADSAIEFHYTFKEKDV